MSNDHPGLRDDRGYRVELGQPRGATGAPVSPPIDYQTLDIRRLTIALDSAQDKVKLDVGGAWIWCIDTQGTDASVDVYFNSASGDPMTFQRGQLLAGKRFHTLYVSNTAQAGASVTFHISLDPHLLIQNSVSIAGLTQLVRAGTFAHNVVSVGVAATAIVAADANRYRAWIQSAQTNTDLIYVGNTAGVTTANAGMVLAPGEGEWFEGSDAVYAISGTASQSVRYFTEAA